MQHTGESGLQADVRAVIELVLADRPGDWRVSIAGSQANDRWEMKIVAPIIRRVGWLCRWNARVVSWTDCSFVATPCFAEFYQVSPVIIYLLAAGYVLLGPGFKTGRSLVWISWKAVKG
jgi:hypothetical protein